MDRKQLLQEIRNILVSEEQSQDSKKNYMQSLANYFANKFGADTDPASSYYRAQGENQLEQAARDEMAAQQNLQIANRDYRGEAEKNAVAGAAIANAQNVANQGNISGAAAALNRNIVNADYNTQMQRADEQRRFGVENQRTAASNIDVADDSFAKAAAADKAATEKNKENIMSDSLSQPVGVSTQEENVSAPDFKMPEKVKTSEPQVIKSLGKIDENTFSEDKIKDSIDKSGNMKPNNANNLAQDSSNFKKAKDKTAKVTKRSKIEDITFKDSVQKSMDKALSGFNYNKNINPNILNGVSLRF